MADIDDFGKLPLVRRLFFWRKMKEDPSFGTKTIKTSIKASTGFCTITIDVHVLYKVDAVYT